MGMDKFSAALLQFLILFPAVASCYLTVKNRMKYSLVKTAVLCMAVILSYAFAGALISTLFSIDGNVLLLLFPVPFFFLYRRTVDVDLSCALSVYTGVCAIETFPVQFGYAFDAVLHPLSGAAALSTEASLFRFGLSLLMLAVFFYPATRHFQIAVHRLDFPTFWYSTVPLFLVFCMLNILAVPRSYSTLQAGRMRWIFPVFEAGMFAVLVAIYVFFYRTVIVILERSELKERTRLLEMQARRYQALQDHMRQTARMRHDFRHSVCLLASLAEKGDMDSVRAHLAEYEISLAEHTSVDYCENAALNALFGYYHEMADTAGIRTDWHIELPKPLPFLESDMAALFGNLMENAVAGCCTVSEKVRYFCLTTEVRHENRLYIVSTNSFDGKVKRGREGYLSTKRGGRGVGLASIAAVSEKYGGSAKASNSDTEFFVDVVLKI